MVTTKLNLRLIADVSKKKNVILRHLEVKVDVNGANLAV